MTPFKYVGHIRSITVSVLASPLTRKALFGLPWLVFVRLGLLYSRVLKGYILSQFKIVALPADSSLRKAAVLGIDPSWILRLILHGPLFLSSDKYVLIEVRNPLKRAPGLPRGE